MSMKKCGRHEKRFLASRHSLSCIYRLLGDCLHSGDLDLLVSLGDLEPDLLLLNEGRGEYDLDLVLY